MSTSRIIGWIVGVVLLILWAQIILGVAVFAIPDRYDGSESMIASLFAIGIGVAVPAAAFWLFKALTVDHSPEPIHYEPMKAVRADIVTTHRVTGEEFEVAPAMIPAFVEPLSERELEILRHVALGKSNKDIANDLVISVGTVKTHTNNLYRKLGARNRTEAVALARHRELL